MIGSGISPADFTYLTYLSIEIFSFFQMADSPDSVAPVAPPDVVNDNTNDLYNDIFSYGGTSTNDADDTQEAEPKVCKNYQACLVL